MKCPHFSIITKYSYIMEVDIMEICISDFKARSLKLLDKIHHSGESITVTKRGIPIARVVPICDYKNEIDLKGTLIEQDEDIFSTGEKWDSNS